MESDGGNLLQQYEQRFEKLSEDQKLSRQCSEAGLRLVKVAQFSRLFRLQEEMQINPFCREHTLPRDQEGTRIKRMDPKQRTIWPNLGQKKFAIYTEDAVLKFKFNLCLKIKPNLGQEL